MSEPQKSPQTPLKVSFKTISADDEGQRLDNYLARTLRGVPRSLLYRILRRGEVRVNKARVSPSYKLKAGDEVRVPPVKVTEAKVTVPSSNLHLVQDLKQRILFENNEIIVVDKPAGLAAHGGSGIEFGLIEALRALRPEQSFLELAHRLDRETSGCLIVAKRRSALRNLHEQFRQRVVKKRYLTLVPGKWDRRQKLIEAPLIRNELKSGERMVMVNFKDGAPSATGFDVVEELNDATLLAAMPHTGRTHQIRVHMAEIGHPVVGDMTYSNGKNPFNVQGQMLHAKKIEFLHPTTKEKMIIEAPIPDYFKQVIETLDKMI